MTIHIQNNCLKAALAVCLAFFTLTVHAQTIVIDPGHGYASDGSNPDGRTETEMATALSVGLKLRDQLNSQCSNYKVYMTRTTKNGWISISQRRDMSNSWGANRFISIHCNAGGGTGTETFWCDRSTSGSTNNSKFSREVQDRMAAGGSWTNRRSVEDATYIYHLGVLNSNNAIGVLNEIGFVDSNDKYKLLDDAWRNKFAGAYVTALKNSLGVTCTPASTGTLIQAETYSSVQVGAVQTETCSDTGGGLNVAYIDTGDEFSYSNVSFPSSGSYKIEYRVASKPGGGTIEAILTGVVVLGRVNVPATGGWQTGWTTISHTVNVNQAGTYTLRLKAIAGGWNLNWLRISKLTTARMATANMEVAEVAEAPVPYPNPAENELSVRFAGTAASGKILNSVGQTVLTLPTLASDTPIDISSLKSGVYILDMIIDGKKVTNRFIKR